MSIGRGAANAEVFQGSVFRNYEGVPDTGTATKPVKILLERWLEMFSATEDLSIPSNCRSLNWKDDQPKGTPNTI